MGDRCPERVDPGFVLHSSAMRIPAVLLPMVLAAIATPLAAQGRPALDRVLHRWIGAYEKGQIRLDELAVKKGRVLATSFHPELTADTRLHALFVQLAREARKVSKDALDSPKSEAPSRSPGATGGPADTVTTEEISSTA